MLGPKERVENGWAESMVKRTRKCSRRTKGHLRDSE